MNELAYFTCAKRQSSQNIRQMRTNVTSIADKMDKFAHLSLSHGHFLEFSLDL